MDEKIRVHAVIKGRVQGVFFRLETLQAAQRIGVTGWVKNRTDGGVEVLIEGSPEKVNRLLEWCRHGPPRARVDSLKSTRQPYSGEFATFEVRY